MRPQKSSDKDVLSGLTEVFRSKGYEAASLQDLAKATGLKKASLYHRFPGGKKEMAEAVFAHLGEWVKENVFQIMKKTQESPQIRLKKGIAQIRVLYDDGEKTCIFRALSMKTGISLFASQIESGLRDWIKIFEQIGLELGLIPKIAKENAIQTLSEIQGSLILAIGLNDPSIFDKTLKGIENRYIVY